MRISVLEDDPGYRPDAATKFDVYFNGELRDDCHTADEELGAIGVYAYAKNGELLRDPDGNLFSIRFEGEVIIAMGTA